MTPQQLAVLDFVRTEIATIGLPPTMEAICQKFDLAAKSSAHRLVSALVEAGKLVRRPGKPRGLELPNAPDLRAVDSADLRAELGRRGETADALTRSGLPNWSRRAVQCAADGCDIEVQRGHLMCRQHWFTLPPSLQGSIRMAYGRRDAAAVERLVREARQIATASHA